MKRGFVQSPAHPNALACPFCARFDYAGHTDDCLIATQEGRIERLESMLQSLIMQFQWKRINDGDRLTLQMARDVLRAGKERK